MELIHKRKPFRCTICSFSTNYKHNLKGHEAAKHRPELKEHRCRHCGATFVFQSHVRVHERIHTRQFPVNCPQCPKGFNSERELKKHLPTHSAVRHAKQQRGIAFKCEKCPELFAQGAALKQHVAKKHPPIPKKFPCDHCDFSSDYKKYLQLHRQRKHLQGVQKKFDCEQCGKPFESPFHLRRHLRVHTKEKPFTCHDCQKAFSEKFHLMNHIRAVHLKMKPFKCRDCGKVFARRSNLRVHMESKNGEKVKCGRCGLQLASKASLAQHLYRLHGDQPMYRCQICGKGIAFKHNLKRHEEGHLQGRF